MPCGRLLSRDDIFDKDEMLIYRPHEEAYICSSCQDIMYPYDEEPMMRYYDVQDHLRLRQTTVPFPWLRAYRENIFKELQEYLHHPTHVQKWIERGHNLEAYN